MVKLIEFNSQLAHQTYRFSIVNNTLGYELRNGGSIPSRGTIIETYSNITPASECPGNVTSGLMLMKCVSIMGAAEGCGSALQVDCLEGFDTPGLHQRKSPKGQ